MKYSFSYNLQFVLLSALLLNLPASLLAQGINPCEPPEDPPGEKEPAAPAKPARGKKQLQPQPDKNKA